MTRCISGNLKKIFLKKPHTVFFPTGNHHFTFPPTAHKVSVLAWVWALTANLGLSCDTQWGLWATEPAACKDFLLWLSGVTIEAPGEVGREEKSGRRGTDSLTVSGFVFETTGIS